MVDTTDVSPASPSTPLASGVPIAVIGFGFSVIMLSLFNIGALDGGSFAFFPLVAMGTGAVAMFVGGIWEARTANVFGATFAIAYACFLLTTGVILQFFAPSIRETSGDAVFNHGFGAYLILWAIFTAIMAVGSYYINLPAFLAFTLLVVVYLLAGLSNFTSGDTSVLLTRIAGWAGILDGVAAWYLGLGILLNEMTGRELFPMRPHRSG